MIISTSGHTLLEREPVTPASAGVPERRAATALPEAAYAIGAVTAATARVLAGYPDACLVPEVRAFKAAIEPLLIDAAQASYAIGAVTAIARVLASYPDECLVPEVRAFKAALEPLLLDAARAATPAGITGAGDSLAGRGPVERVNAAFDHVTHVHAAAPAGGIAGCSEMRAEPHALEDGWEHPGAYGVEEQRVNRVPSPDSHGSTQDPASEAGDDFSTAPAPSTLTVTTVARSAAPPPDFGAEPQDYIGRMMRQAFLTAFPSTVALPADTPSAAQFSVLRATPCPDDASSKSTTRARPGAATSSKNWRAGHGHSFGFGSRQQAGTRA